MQSRELCVSLTWLRLFRTNSRQVIDAGSRAEVFAQAIGWIFMQRPAYIRLGIIKIAKDACSRRAGVHTCRSRLPVHARFLSQSKTAIKGLITEGAFLR